MTILSLIQEASSKLGIARPTAVMASTDRTMIELKDFVNELAPRVAKAHEWRALAVQATYTGNGVLEDFNLPSDYDRMPVKAKVWSSSLKNQLSQVLDLDTWLGLTVQNVNLVFGSWIIYGGQIHIKTAMAAGVTAKHWYQSNKIVTLAGGGTGTAFVADGDTFRLDERLLRLALVWEWKASKGRPYAEDMDTYEEAKEKLINADRGSRILTVGRPRMRGDFDIALPVTVVP